ncbi:MAG TPA: NAD(P)H-hydrate dehydratase [Candidatus Thermoplasmatota archaeon]|nr:NAD(P)H-hydrate dehydratase [Candidatus Thermoplasmatota archaeon]
MGGTLPFDLTKLYPERTPDFTPFTGGHALVLAGSDRATAPAVLSAAATLRAGADAVTVLAPPGAAESVRAHVAEAETVSLAGPVFSGLDVELVVEEAEVADAVLIGGGLGTRDETVRAVRALISELDVPIIVNGDVTPALHGHEDLVKGRAAVIALSARALAHGAGKETPKTMDDLVALANAEAQRLQTTLLVEGPRAVVADAKRHHVAGLASAYAAKTGHHCVVEGATLALLARGVPAYEASSAAAHLGAFAFDLAALTLGDGLLAADAVTFLPRALVEARRRAATTHLSNGIVTPSPLAPAPATPAPPS